MIFLPDTNACITLLRQKHSQLLSRWRAAKPVEICLCSIVVYELRHGAERSQDAAAEHVKVDAFLRPYVSLPFDDACAARCARIRRQLEQSGMRIGPHDLQIAAIAVEHNLTLVTHNIKEFSRVSGIKIDDWEI